MLLFPTRAPHPPAIPAPGDENLYPNLPLHRPPNYNEADVSDKPLWLQGRPLLGPGGQQQIDIFRRQQLQTLWSVDQVIGAILDRLEQQGELDNTAIFFISDNGTLWGEHRLTKKNRIYEEVSRVPFALRYPPLVSAGQSEDRLAANIDIAPTIYELAGLPVLPQVDGRSLVPLLQGQGDWRNDLLIEGAGALRRMPFAAVHTGRYVYVDNKRGADLPELYDLQVDPYQLESKVNDPAYTDVLFEMRGRLKRYRAGDINGDWCVDDSDLAAVVFAFGQTGSNLPADVNNDRIVDDADLSEVIFHLGEGC
jgi:hypothetical protein